MHLTFDFTESATRTSFAGQLRKQLGEDEWAAVEEEASRAGVPEGHCHGIVEVRQVIDGLAVSQDVRGHLREIYEILAAAEAQVHGCEVDETHFHEVGNGAALLDALTTCIAFARLAPEHVAATPVQTGSGQVECAHGLMDIPAPATAAILAQGIPTCPDKLDGELCTPTSAAMIKHFVDEFHTL